jgi:hypothetical protein
VKASLRSRLEGLEQGFEQVPILVCQERQIVLFELAQQHVEIPHQAQATAGLGQLVLRDPFRQQQGRGKLAQQGAQVAKAHPQLVQRFRVPVLEHLALQAHNAFDQQFNALRRIAATAGIATHLVHRIAVRGPATPGQGLSSLWAWQRA